MASPLVLVDKMIDLVYFFVFLILGFYLDREIWIRARNQSFLIFWRKETDKPTHLGLILGLVGHDYHTLFFWADSILRCVSHLCFISLDPLTLLIAKEILFN